jgi:galactose mutarotase-like enzyme
MKNQLLSIAINDKGAELHSIKDSTTGFEFLWQADPAVWGRHAPILFPIVGKVANNEFRIDGNTYPLTQHGFARDLMFMKDTETDLETWYELDSTEETRKVYPFHFSLRLGYELEENTLICKYDVTNRDEKVMYFSIGAHPGFNLPSGKLDDYYIEFNQNETSERHLLSNGLFDGRTKQVLSSPTTIQLSSALFDDDAIVLKDLKSRQLKLKQHNSSFCVTLEYDGFPYMGIWTQKNNEQYVCLEPWCGHADPVSGHTDLSLKEGIIALKPGEVFSRSYSLTFEV